jgi:hypothetical protein
MVASKQEALWRRLREAEYPSLYEDAGVRGLLVGPLSLLNEPCSGKRAHFVLASVPRTPVGAAGEVSVPPSDRPAINASICAEHVLAAAQAYADTGKVGRGFRESMLEGSSAQIQKLARTAPVTFRKGVELTLNYGSGFVEKRTAFL